MGMNMKRIFAATATAAALIGTPAFAADMAVKAPPASTPACIWCGWYVGANAGWVDRDGGQVVGTPVANEGAFGAPLYVGPSAAGATGSLNRGIGFIGGVQAGYNWQANANWVLGWEADIDGASLRGGTNTAALTTVPAFPTFPLSSSINASQRLDYFGTLRARVGFVPTSPLMIYGTAGLAYGRPTANVTVNEQIAGPAGCVAVCTPVGLTLNSSSLRAGWTAGGGVEWMFAPKWSVKAEALYYDLGHTTAAGTLAIPDVGTNFVVTGVQYTSHMQGAIARGGINLHF
jgi:outer membrane immunogenic protein